MVGHYFDSFIKHKVCTLLNFTCDCIVIWKLSQEDNDLVPISVIRAEFEALRGLYGLRDDSKVVRASQRQDLSEFDVDLGQFALLRDGVISNDASAIASILPIPSSHTVGDSFTYGDGANLQQQAAQLEVTVAEQRPHGCCGGHAKAAPEEVEPEAEPELVDWRSIPEAELEAYLNKLFCIADVNGDGVLQPEEFTGLMQNSALDFEDDVILEVSAHSVTQLIEHNWGQVFKGIDSNQDGLIQYEEFMTGVMSTLRAFSSRGDGLIRDADKDRVQNTVATA